MAIFINANMRRTQQDSITFKDSTGAAITLVNGDNVRIKIGRSGEAPLLDLTSAGTNSKCTDANPSTVTLHQDDLVAGTIKPGVYDIEACIVDSGDSNRIKHAESGVLSLHDTPLGDVGDVT